MISDASGNVYFTDTSNCVVRKIATNGVISTVAGNGVCTYTGEDVDASVAGFKGPTYLALNSDASVLYISDTSGYRVRKLTFATNKVKTVAGTGSTAFTADGSAATSTNLSSPRGLAIDASNNIYVAETGNARIRMFTDGGTVSTITGDGTAATLGDNGAPSSAEISQPYDLALDSTGRYLYIDDYNAYRIRRIDFTSNVITTYAGTGGSGSTGDGAISTAAKVAGVQGIGVDSTGNLYIADTNNHKVRVVSAVNQFIYTVAGTGTAGSIGDGGVAGSLTTAARLNTPISVLPINANGDFWVTDSVSHRIRLVKR